jgi:hypothetical protein
MRIGSRPIRGRDLANCRTRRSCRHRAYYHRRQAARHVPMLSIAEGLRTGSRLNVRGNPIASGLSRRRGLAAERLIALAYLHR